MKICITSVGESLDDTIDSRFGRCQYFIVVDTESMHYESITNPAISVGGGAGIKAAQLVANKEVEVVLTGNVGPNAFNTLYAAGVNIVVGLSGITVRQACEKFKSGNYHYSGSPSVSAHYGARGVCSDTSCGIGADDGRRISMIPQQFAPQMSKNQELKILREQSQKMKRDLEMMQSRIDELMRKNP